MVLYKHTVNFTFNGGLKHPADLVDGETCSKKLKKKILLLTNKLMSDIKVSLAPIVLFLFFKSENAHHPCSLVLFCVQLGGEGMIALYPCLEAMFVEWCKNSIRPRLVGRPGFRQKKNATTSGNVLSLSLQIVILCAFCVTCPTDQNQHQNKESLGVYVGLMLNAPAPD